MKRSALKRGKPLAHGTKRLKARKTPKAFRKRRDPAYTEWVRQQTCLLLGHLRNEPERILGLRNGQLLTFPIHACRTPVQVCHAKSRGAGGDDRANVVALCGELHEEQHRIGLRSFQARWGIDLKGEAERLYQQYVQEQGIAGSTPAGL